MKVIVFGLTFLCAAWHVALAADVPARTAPPVYVPPEAVFSWTGAYAGLNAGYAFDGHTTYSINGTDLQTTSSIARGVRPSFFQTRADGFTGGAQIGYNFQFAGVSDASSLGRTRGILIGVEADAAYTDLRDTGNFIGTTARVVTFRSQTDYVGTVRGRLGYAFGNVLVFGSGGFAYGGVRDNVDYFTNAGVRNFTGTTDSIHPGYVYGGGVEYALASDSVLNVVHSGTVTLKAEFLHYGLEAQTLHANNILGFGNAYLARTKIDGDLVRAGINYKFDVAADPVVARY